MAKPLNFNNLKKRYLSVTLADENQTTLFIGMPSKVIMDNLTLLQASLESIRDNENDADAIDDMYDACAKVMSRNKAGIRIDKEFLENLFDMEDIIVFFDAYMNFVTEVTDQKN